METTAEAWDRTSANYSRGVTRFTTLYAEDLLRTVPQLRTARTVLEIACGSGALLHAYLKVFPDGISGQTLVFSDFSPRMLQLTRDAVSRYARNSQTTFDFRLLDASDMAAIETGSVDLVLSVFGVFMIGGNVLREIHRVLRPGGTFGNVSWTAVPKFEGHGTPFHEAVGPVMKRLQGGQEQTEEMAKVVRWGEVDGVTGMLEEVGFQAVAYRNLHTVVFRDVEEIWEFLRDNPVVAVEELKDEDVRAFKKQIADTFGNGIVYTLMAAIIGVGEKL